MAAAASSPPPRLVEVANLVDRIYEKEERKEETFVSLEEYVALSSRKAQTTETKEEKRARVYKEWKESKRSNGKPKAIPKEPPVTMLVLDITAVSTRSQFVHIVEGESKATVGYVPTLVMFANEASPSSSDTLITIYCDVVAPNLPPGTYTGPSAFPSFGIYPCRWLPEPTLRLSFPLPVISSTAPHSRGGDPMMHEMTLPFMREVISRRLEVYQLIRPFLLSGDVRKFHSTLVPASLRSFLYVLGRKDWYEDLVSYYLVSHLTALSGQFREWVECFLGPHCARGCPSGAWALLENTLFYIRCTSSAYCQLDRILGVGNEGCVFSALPWASVPTTVRMRKLREVYRPCVSEWFVCDFEHALGAGSIVSSSSSSWLRKQSFAVPEFSGGMAYLTYFHLLGIVLSRCESNLRLTTNRIITMQPMHPLRVHREYAQGVFACLKAVATSAQLGMPETSRLVQLEFALEHMPPCLSRMINTRGESKEVFGPRGHPCHIQRVVFIAYLLRSGATPKQVASLLAPPSASANSLLPARLHQPVSSFGVAPGAWVTDAQREITSLAVNGRAFRSNVNYGCKKMGEIGACPFAGSCLSPGLARAACVMTTPAPGARFNGPWARLLAVAEAVEKKNKQAV